ncbi:MAG: hypothetical protein ACLQD9_00575 [Thermoplasmata archaeon]
MSMGQGALILGVVALILGGSALGIALTKGGPAGAAGAKGTNGTNGTRGPAGPGAVVGQSFNDGTTVLTGACGYYNGSNLSFTVSGPGTFVLAASVEILMQHTLTDFVFFSASLSNASSTCNPDLNNFVDYDLSDSLPTANYYAELSLDQSFPVGAAGAYTFDVIGVASGGTDTADFYFGSVVGVFYPA